MNNYNQNYDYGRYDQSPAQSFAVDVPVLMRRVYLWMSIALVVSGLSAYLVATTPRISSLIFSSNIVFYGLCIAELVVVYAISAMINKLSFPVAAGLFALYSLLNGVTLSSIFVVYELSSIAQTFFITAGTFGAMALIGTFVKKDLGGFARILTMVLIGVIIASVVNFFLGSGILDLIISVIGIVIFAGLTAYDAQKIKEMAVELSRSDEGTMQKAALCGALSLYLDFINLFLYLLRFFGRRK